MLTQDQLAELRKHPISWSRLKFYDRSPAHFLENWLHPPEATAAMTLGSALHCLALEPDKFGERYITPPEGIDKRTKAGKEQWAAFEAEAAGREILTAEQMTQARGMAEAIAASRVASRALARCEAREAEIGWLDPITGLACKGRLDAWCADWIIDVKTTDDANFVPFARAIANYQYHGQAAFYLDGLRTHSGISVGNVLFIVVEKNRPHGVRAYTCSEAMLTAGRALYRGLLDKHAECLERGEWPGYEDKAEDIDLPRWAA